MAITKAAELAARVKAKKLQSTECRGWLAHKPNEPIHTKSIPMPNVTMKATA